MKAGIIGDFRLAEKHSNDRLIARIGPAESLQTLRSEQSTCITHKLSLSDAEFTPTMT